MTTTEGTGVSAADLLDGLDVRSADELLAAYATPAEPRADGTEQWAFGLYPHSRDDALAIIRCCLYLGVPVTDALMAGTWVALLRRVNALERRLAELEVPR